MDIAGMWRSLRINPADIPRAGVRVQSAGSEITIGVTQECLIALPPRQSRIPEVSVTRMLAHSGRFRGAGLEDHPYSYSKSEPRSSRAHRGASA